MWKGKKRKQEEEEQTNVYIRKHVEKPKEQSSPQVLQLQSKTKREGKNKKLKLGVDPVKLIHQEEQTKLTHVDDKPKGKKRKQASEEGNKREGKKRKQTSEQTTIQIGKHVDKPKPKGKQGKQTTTVQIGGEEDQTTTSIQIGDVVNLSDLLFTDTRDYLIKYKDNQLVKDDQLAGKVVVLLFVPLTIRKKYLEERLLDVLDLYAELEPKGSFEVVFVAYESTYSSTPPDPDRFQECFSTMPWTAIPFSDTKSRKRLQTKFDVFSFTWYNVEPTMVVIDPRGMVVQRRATHIFERYGPAGFPFTNKRLECLDAEDNVALSVKTLLASPERDYVITNKGERVPLHKLEDKVVGLLFSQYNPEDCIAWKLKMIYEELSKKDFEVVLVNVSPVSSVAVEDAWRKTFETMPWLAIPFKDTYTSKKLMRIFANIICDPGPDHVPKLVIIGPHGEFIEPLGAEVMIFYGIPAYPFTCSSAVKLKIKSIKDLKLEMLWNLDSVFRQQNGSRVQFSQIVGKRIIVLYRCYEETALPKHSEHCKHSLNKLKALYIQMKGTDDEFEVIQIHGARGVGCVAEGAPWLMHPPFDKASDAGQVLTHLFGGLCRGLFAFDRDGTIVRMTHYPATIGEMVFPFYEVEDCMEDEVLDIVTSEVDFPLEVLSSCR